MNVALREADFQPGLHRRSFLRGIFPAAIGAAATVGCVSEGLSAPATTPIARVAHAWMAEEERVNALPGDMDDEAIFEEGAERRRLEKEMKALPIASLADLALKTMVLSWFGDFNLDREQVQECTAFMRSEAR